MFQEQEEVMKKKIGVFAVGAALVFGMATGAWAQSSGAGGTGGGAPGAGGPSAGDSTAVLRTVLAAATPVHGTWGSGRLLRTSLISVLITDGGRTFVGAVQPSVLYAAVGQAAAPSSSTAP